MVVNWLSLLEYFAEVVTTISRSVRQCVLRLSEDKISFASLESGVLGGVNLWCELSQVRSLYNIRYALQLHNIQSLHCVRVCVHRRWCVTICI